MEHIKKWTIKVPKNGGLHHLYIIYGVMCTVKQMLGGVRLSLWK